jgi:hypothetical protein
MDNPQLKSMSFQIQIKPNASAAPSISKFHQGLFYYELLKQIHQVRKPSSYLEIGVETGATLGFAQCPTVAIDPRFQFIGNPIGQRQETYLFQLKSDEFFTKHDVKKFLPNGVDFAFLDGMHHFEFLLRDFINTEKYSHRDTVVAMHDCYPVNAEIADRDRHHDRRVDGMTRDWWAGDVWKLLPIFRDLRPDLDVAILDCPPTGLVVIKGLDPNSDTLIKAYDGIIAKYQGMTLENYGIEKFRSEFLTTDSRRVFPPDVLKDFLTLQK